MSDWPAFSILFICTGNVCRSPIAERLMQAGLQRRLGSEADDFSVSSAGTMAWIGEPMQPFAAQTVVELGGAADNFRARELTADHVAAAQLVLCAAREHRARVVTMLPQAASRCFTLREFGRLAADLPVRDFAVLALAERGPALVRATAARRGTGPPVAAGSDDVADPLGQSLAAFRSCATSLSRNLEVVLDRVAAASESAAAGDQPDSDKAPTRPHESEYGAEQRRVRRFWRAGQTEGRRAWLRPGSQ